MGAARRAALRGDAAHRCGAADRRSGRGGRSAAASSERRRPHAARVEARPTIHSSLVGTSRCRARSASGTVYGSRRIYSSADAAGCPAIRRSCTKARRSRRRWPGAIQSLVKETASGIPSIESDAARNLQRRAGLLNDAARWLREALERDATLLEPRLHLGRVETLRGNETDALVHLERVFSSTTDPAAAYLAALFSGAAHERLRRPDAAEASYRRAIERLPAGQAAYVALSEVLQRSGRSGESQAVLQTLVNAKPGSGDEPWWWYLVDPPGRRRRADRRARVARCDREGPDRRSGRGASWWPARRSSAFAAAWTPCAWTCSSPTVIARSEG